jgi:hypothetical protein
MQRTYGKLAIAAKNVFEQWVPNAGLKTLNECNLHKLNAKYLQRTGKELAENK